MGFIEVAKMSRKDVELCQGIDTPDGTAFFRGDEVVLVVDLPKGSEIHLRGKSTRVYSTLSAARVVEMIEEAKGSEYYICEDDSFVTVA
jgi:hypothetical protein